jgi:predicted transcriptional regulator
MTFTKDAEKQDNENYSKNFTRVPNIVFASYKHLSKEEKFLYCTLRQIYWDMKPRFVTVRELSTQTGYSPSALCKMIPRLHTCGLIHAEVRKEKGKDGKEKGNPKYHITIPDIWELNRQFFACSPEEQGKIDPSLKLVHENEQVLANPVHENEQACSPNNTRLFTKTNKPVLFGEQDQAQVERAKDSIKDTLKKDRKIETPAVNNPEPSFSHSITPSSFLSLSSETKAEVVFTQEEQAVYALAEQLDLVYLKRDENHKGSCAKLAAKGVVTLEKMESLIAHCKQVPFLAGKTLNLKNLVNELAGWLQLQRKATAAPSSSPVVSTMGKSTAGLLAELEAKRKRIMEQAAQGGPGLTPTERMAIYKQEQKEKLLKGKLEYEAKLARGENPY